MSIYDPSDPQQRVLTRAFLEATKRREDEALAAKFEAELEAAGRRLVLGEQTFEYHAAGTEWQQRESDRLYQKYPFSQYLKGWKVWDNRAVFKVAGEIMAAGGGPEIGALYLVRLGEAHSDEEAARVRSAIRSLSDWGHSRLYWLTLAWVRDVMRAIQRAQEQGRAAAAARDAAPENPGIAFLRGLSATGITLKYSDDAPPSSNGNGHHE